MENILGIAIGAFITAVGTIAALLLAAYLSRNKDVATVEGLEIDNEGKLTSRAMQMLERETARINKLEEQRIKDRDRMRALEIENIDLRKHQAQLEVEVEENKKCQENYTRILDYLSDLYEGTTINIQQLIELGEAPRYTPPPILRGSGKEEAS